MGDLWKAGPGFYGMVDPNVAGDISWHGSGVGFFVDGAQMDIRKSTSKVLWSVDKPGRRQRYASLSVFLGQLGPGGDRLHS